MAYGNLRRTGIAQLIFGIFSLVTGIAILALYFSFVADNPNAYQIAAFLGFFASPIYCSIWPIIAGAVGSCAKAERSDSITCIKVCVILFSIFAVIAAAIQTGLCAFIGVAQLGYFTSGNGQLVAIEALTFAGCFFGVLTFFTAIVHASIGCCCPGEVDRHETYQMK